MCICAYVYIYTQVLSNRLGPERTSWSWERQKPCPGPRREAQWLPIRVRYSAPTTGALGMEPVWVGPWSLPGPSPPLLFAHADNLSLISFLCCGDWAYGAHWAAVAAGYFWELGGVMPTSSPDPLHECCLSPWTHPLPCLFPTPTQAVLGLGAFACSISSAVKPFPRPGKPACLCPKASASVCCGWPHLLGTFSLADPCALWRIVSDTLALSPS